MTVRVSRDIAAATRHIKHGILIRRERQTKRYRRRIQIREARATLNEWRLPGHYIIQPSTFRRTCLKSVNDFSSSSILTGRTSVDP